MAWQDYVKGCARRLAACKSEAEVRHVISLIQAEIASASFSPELTDQFWREVRAAYMELPVYIQKEATAAASLNQLLATSDALMAARLQKK